MFLRLAHYGKFLMYKKKNKEGIPTLEKLLKVVF